MPTRFRMNDYDAARAIAFDLLMVGDSLDEATVRRAAEIAVWAVCAQAGYLVDVDVLVRDLEANVNVVVGDAPTT